MKCGFFPLALAVLVFPGVSISAEESFSLVAYCQSKAEGAYGVKELELYVEPAFINRPLAAPARQKAMLTFLESGREAAALQATPATISLTADRKILTEYEFVEKDRSGKIVRTKTGSLAIDVERFRNDKDSESVFRRSTVTDADRAAPAVTETLTFECRKMVLFQYPPRPHFGSVR